MVSTQAIDIRNGIKLGIETGEKAYKSIQGGKHGEGINWLDRQLDNLGQTETKANVMIDEAKEFEQRMSSLNELCIRMDNLEVNNIHLKNEVEELVYWKRHVETSQTAIDFENDLAAYIYPPSTSITFGPIFHNLMLWLDQNQNTPEGQEANNKWIALQVETGIQWTDAHEMVLFKMYKCKMAITHQEIVTFSNDDETRRKEILVMNEFIKPKLKR